MVSGFREATCVGWVDGAALDPPVRLNAEISAPKAVPGSYRSVRFLILLGVITLLVALVRYVSLATPRALDRASCDWSPMLQRLDVGEQAGKCHGTNLLGEGE